MSSPYHPGILDRIQLLCTFLVFKQRCSGLRCWATMRPTMLRCSSELCYCLHPSFRATPRPQSSAASIWRTMYPIELRYTLWPYELCCTLWAMSELCWTFTDPSTFVHWTVSLNAEMPDCLASGLPGTGMIKCRWRNQSGTGIRWSHPVYRNAPLPDWDDVYRNADAGGIGLDVIAQQCL